jgi:hypothetical protein
VSSLYRNPNNPKMNPFSPSKPFSFSFPASPSPSATPFGASSFSVPHISTFPPSGFSSPASSGPAPAFSHKQAFSFGPASAQKPSLFNPTQSPGSGFGISAAAPLSFGKSTAGPLPNPSLLALRAKQQGRGLKAEQPTLLPVTPQFQHFFNNPKYSDLTLSATVTGPDGSCQTVSVVSPAVV